MLKLIAFISTAVLLTSCWDFYRKPYLYNPKKVLGYKPVYSTDTTLLQVKALGPQSVSFPGKIYVKDKLIFQSETGYGIHVIDNTDPAQAKRIGFIQIKGNSEISIKGNFLYANSFTDLVIADISNWQQVTEIKRIKNAFQYGSTLQQYNFIPLPEHNVYYECGYYNAYGQVQTGWVKDSVYNNNCYYP